MSASSSSTVFFFFFFSSGIWYNPAQRQMMDGFPAGQRMKITATTGGIVFQHPLEQKAGKKKKVNFMRFVYRVGEWRWGWLRTSVCLRATFQIGRASCRERV